MPRNENECDVLFSLLWTEKDKKESKEGGWSIIVQRKTRGNTHKCSFFSSLEASCFEIGLFCSDIGCIQRG